MSIFNKKSKVDDQDVTEKVASSVTVKEEVVKKPAVKSAKKKDFSKNTTEKSKGYGTAYRILLRPLVSEKATIAHAENKYIFEVDVRANKIEVKKAIEEVYGTVPAAVNIINQDGKTVRFGQRKGRTKNVKKAIVTLKKGDSITIYEGI